MDADVESDKPGELPVLRHYFNLFQGDYYQSRYCQDALTPAHIEHLVSPDVVFQDPFQRITGPEAVCRLLNHFHGSVDNARFSIEAVCPYPDVPESRQTFLVRWQFSGELSILGLWCFPGVSEIELDSSGRVVRHIDFWDASEHFYARLPLLGRLIHWVQRKIAV